MSEVDDRLAKMRQRQGVVPQQPTGHAGPRPKPVQQTHQPVQAARSADQTANEMAKQAKAAQKAKTAAPKQKPKMEVIGNEPITHSCGHEGVFPIFKVDGFLEKRREKHQKRKCPTCAAEQAVANQERAKQNKLNKAKKKLGRFVPLDCAVGCRFELDHVGPGLWTCRLVQLNNGAVLAIYQGKSLNKALGDLSEQWLKLNRSASVLEVKEPGGD